MKATFADTSYWIALVLTTDAYHQRAVAANSRIGAVITTRFVLAELGAALARAALRHIFLAILDQIEADPAFPNRRCGRTVVSGGRRLVSPAPGQGLVTDRLHLVRRDATRRPD